MLENYVAPFKEHDVFPLLGGDNTYTLAIAMADVNNDALPDIVSFSSLSTHSLVVLRHVSESLPPPDFVMHAFPPQHIAVSHEASNEWDIAIAPRNGQAGTVSFSLAGLPDGVG